MWPTLIKIFGIMIPWWVIVAILGTIISSFYWWRTMRIDYEEEKIFGGTLGMILLMGLIGVGSSLITKTVGVEVGFLWIMGLVFWWWICIKQHWDFWEWLDVLVPSGLLLGVFISLAIGPVRFIYAGVYFGVWLINRWVAVNYRKIKWYESGRIGFSGMVGIFGWSLSEMVVEIWKGNGIYWVGLTIDQWLSVVVFTVSLTAIYIRSGRKITKDLPFLSGNKI
jgi:hypothetical protein